MTISGATYREGVAYSPDGAMYVTLDPTGSYSGVNVSSTGQFLAANGTANAPSIAWTSDNDGTGTGFYRPGADSIGASVGGTLKYWLTSGGGLFSQDGFAFGASSASIDGLVSRAAPNSVQFSGGTVAAGAATARTEINKAVTAFTNAVAKTVFTVTIPNAAHNATIEIRVQGALGAGGAIGAGEAMATNTYVIGVVRTAGVATVATATAAFGAVAVAVAGAATVTATAAVTAMSGAVGATQTFDIQVTISRSGGSSDNHTCLAYAKLLNANGTGITIA